METRVENRRKGRQRLGGDIWVQLKAPTAFETCLERTLRGIGSEESTFYWILENIKEHDVFDTISTMKQPATRTQLLLVVRYLAEPTITAEELCHELKLDRREFDACVERISRAVLDLQFDCDMQPVQFQRLLCYDVDGHSVEIETGVTPSNHVILLRNGATLSTTSLSSPSEPCYNALFRRFQRLQQPTIPLTSQRFIRAQLRRISRLIQTGIVLNLLFDHCPIKNIG
ncbi:hypothetical protein TRICI_006495 [Trichomonascus ciferrii]|uniref:Uncharacterized protein n=1 Tax=Trichomonascus ciferrii TaxID=44093 RepID=A0A642UKW5_9ASCO|nr:hypothetical protein TRICI_006495 [Trichomonascus ciferrii]